MQLLDDDEIQRVDGTYLGPPGKYIGRIRYRVLAFFIIICPLLLVLLDKTFGISFWPVVWIVMGSMWLSGKAADNLTLDRQVTTSIAVFFRELGTPRSPTKAVRVHGPRKIIAYRAMAPQHTVRRPARSREL